jgi:hypothetical protein
MVFVISLYYTLSVNATRETNAKQTICLLHINKK